jgi:hypothetical protein
MTTSASDGNLELVFIVKFDPLKMTQSK